MGDAPTAEVHGPFEVGHRQAVGGATQGFEDRLDVLPGREGGVDKPCGDIGITPAVQEDAVGVVEGTPGAPNLLVVGDDRPGYLKVDDEAEVGLVEAHAKGRGGDEGLDAILEEGLFEGDASIVLVAAGVGVDGVALQAKPRGDAVGVALGEGIDDPAAGQGMEVVGKPREAFGAVGQADSLQSE